MLDQVIFTRCEPGRNLLGNGEVVRKNGYGAFTMSRELFADTDAKNRQALQARFSDYNGSKENGPQGLIRSYQYVILPGGQGAMISCAMRPKKETENVSDGQDARPNAFVEQALVGSFGDYPVRWFGSGEWDAHRRSRLDYYLNRPGDPKPPSLPQAADVPSGGYVDDEKVRAFIRDGRQETVKACLWFLLQESGKPQEERKMLLIRDIPERVELWIAAIESGFSAGLAGTIPFATNRTNLGNNQAEARLFCDPEAANLPPGARMQARPNAKKVPLYMIAGFHPKDPQCASVRQNSTSRFELLDGETGSLGVEPDATVGAAYYRAVAEAGEDIRYFREKVLPWIPMDRISAKITELYDASQYLLSAEHRPDTWSYEESRDHLQKLSQFGICENAALAGYLLDEFQSVYGGSFMTADAKAGYPLLALLGEYAAKAGREEDITNLLADGLLRALRDRKKSGSRVTETWALLSRADQNLVQPVLRTVFIPREFADWKECWQNAFEGCTADCVKAMSDMYFTMLSGCGGQCGTETAHLQFAAAAVYAVRKDQRALEGIVNEIRDFPGYASRAVLDVLCAVGHDGEEPLWDVLLGSCGETVAVCEAALDHGVEPERIEAALARQIRKAGSCSAEVEKAFYALLDRTGVPGNMGETFYGTWLSCCRGRDYADFIRSVEGARLPGQTQNVLFERMDGSIPADALLSSGEIPVEKLISWGNFLGRGSRTGARYDILRTMKTAGTAAQALDGLERYMKYPLQENERFFDSRYFREIAAMAGGFCSAEVHLAVIAVFAADSRRILDTQGGVLPRDVERTMEIAAERYVSTVLAESKKHMAETMAGFGKVIQFFVPVNGVSEAYADVISRKLQAAFERALPEYYKPKLKDEIGRLKNVDNKVAAYLDGLLAREAEKRGGSGLKGILRGFGGLFGKK